MVLLSFDNCSILKCTLSKFILFIILFDYFKLFRDMFELQLDCNSERLDLYLDVDYIQECIIYVLVDCI